MGLFLGFSIASILEIFEFFVDFFLLSGSCKGRGKSKVTPSPPPEVQKVVSPPPPPRVPTEITTTSPNGSVTNINLQENEDEVQG